EKGDAAWSRQGRRSRDVGPSLDKIGKIGRSGHKIRDRGEVGCDRGAWQEVGVLAGRAHRWLRIPEGISRRAAEARRWLMAAGLTLLRNRLDGGRVKYDINGPKLSCFTRPTGPTA